MTDMVLFTFMSSLEHHNLAVGTCALHLGRLLSNIGSETSYTV